MLHLSKPLRYPVDDENLLIRFLPGNRPAGPTKTCRACGVLIGKGMYCDGCRATEVGSTAIVRREEQRRGYGPYPE